MFGLSRRDFLRYGALAGVGAATGCTGSFAGERPPGTVDPGALEHAGEIVRQPTEQRPGWLRLGLTNDGDGTVRVGLAASWGHPLEDLHPLIGDEGEAVLLPTDSDAVTVMDGGRPEQPVDGCWRFEPGETGDVVVEASAYPVELDAGEAYSVRHDVFYDGPGDSCFPVGSTAARTASKSALGTTLGFEYVLSVAASRAFSLSVERSGGA